MLKHYFYEANRRLGHSENLFRSLPLPCLEVFHSINQWCFLRSEDGLLAIFLKDYQKKQDYFFV